MRPMIQLWLPFFPMSPFDGAAARDLQRIKKEWLWETLIYLSPDYKEVSRFEIRTGEKSRFAALIGIPSETTNLIEVINIDEEGNYFPPTGRRIPERWKGKIPENLFQEWLNCESPVISNVKEMAAFFPVEKNGQVEFEKKPVVLPPYIVSSIKIDKSSKNLLLKWPPKNSNLPSSISPEAEIAERARFTNESEYNPRSWLKWPEPFDRLFPVGGSVDFLYHKDVMKKAIEEKDERTILSWRDKFVSTIKIRFDLIWTFPKLIRDLLSGIDPDSEPDSGILVDLQGKFNIQVNSLKEMSEHKDYIKKFIQPVEIPCIFGWIGYFWWELSQRAKEKSVNICERCGNVIIGNENRRFCSKDENLECFRARKAEDRRRERHLKKRLE